MTIHHVYTPNGALAYLEYTLVDNYTAKIVRPDGTTKCIKPVNWHNEHGPAVINYNEETGNISCLIWLINSYQHRKNKPARINIINGNISYLKYFIHNEYHCDDGPAMIDYDQNGKIQEERWYLNNKYIGNSSAEFKNHIFKYKETYAELYNKILKKDAIHIFN